VTYSKKRQEKKKQAMLPFPGCFAQRGNLQHLEV